MKISPSLPGRLPGYHVFVGFAFLVLGLMAKESLPKTIGSLPAIQLPCAFFSAVLIPFGALLALRGLIFEKTNRRNLLAYYLLGLIFLPVTLSIYFYVFVTMNLILDLPNRVPSILPKLVESARTLPTEQKRMVVAQWAYRLYGVIIAYRLDNLDVAYYVPTEEDKDYRHKQEGSDNQIKAGFELVRKLTNQYPYLFGLYAATFTATFSAGWIWLAIKVPKDSPVPAS